MSYYIGLVLLLEEDAAACVGVGLDSVEKGVVLREKGWGALLFLT